MLNGGNHIMANALMASALGRGRLIGLTLGLVLAACLLSAASWAQGVDAAARAALPDKNLQSGTLEVATSLQWPPFDFKTDDGKPDGLDIRLITALAERLGLKPNFTDVKFPAIVPGVQTGRFDIGVDQLSATPERRKIVQFVPYYRGGLGLLARQDSRKQNVSQLCGLTLALTQGSSQVAVAQRQSEQCVAAGKKPISFQYFPDSADTYMAVANGRGDGFLTDRAVGVYVAQHNGKLVMTEGTLPGTQDVAGIVIGRDNDKLASAIRLALVGMLRDGSYQKLLNDYGVGSAALGPAEVQTPLQ
jgi:polar amino acid transport system substrate-binding protein